MNSFHVQENRRKDRCLRDHGDDWGAKIGLTLDFSKKATTPGDPGCLIHQYFVVKRPVINHDFHVELD